MVKQTIQIFLRLKPPSPKFKTSNYDISCNNEGNTCISMSVPKELQDGTINNKKEMYWFKFDDLFDVDAMQDTIFEKVAKPVCDNVLSGYNGTIFAYGQTGSGKTFTITGGAEKFSDRGIIPRALSYIFNHYKKTSEYEYTTSISYLEIYNENGYDLLDPKHEASKLEDLPKVSLYEDSDQNTHLKNLTIHPATNEEEALNLLFIGDTNRMIAETPMNQASTRSHCIFTIHITCRVAGSATVRRAKLHLVDLAGSERVSKTKANGVLLTEAKYINLSLHYLEQVIVALSDKNRSHIPYRNSMMTAVLKDSLGGNCKTSMIATASIERKNLLESISTCRFAQRVALIKNDVILNEELDPSLLIGRLRKEVDNLKAELALATGEVRADNLNEEEIERCEDSVKSFLNDLDPNCVISSYICSDMRKIHYCYKLIKKLYNERPQSLPSIQESERWLDNPGKREDYKFDNPIYNKEVKELKEIIQQRDNEINILVNMLKKERKKVSEALSNGKGVSGSVGESNRNGRPITSKTYVASAGTEKMSAVLEEEAKGRILGNMSLGREEAFELYKRDYPHNAQIDEQKELLKKHYAQAKILGEKINDSRNKTNRLKSQIEKHRMRRVMSGETDEMVASTPDEDEERLRDEMERQKTAYRDSYSKLKTLKCEIEHIQHLLQGAKVRLIKDFEKWWQEQCDKFEEEQKMSLQSHSKGKNDISTSSTIPNTFSPPSYSGDSVRLPHDDSMPVPPGYRPQATYIRDLDQSSIGSNQRDIQTSHSTVSSMMTSVSQQMPRNLKGFKPHAPGSSSRNHHSSSSIPLTGDATVDADILAFMKARDLIRKKVSQNSYLQE